MAKSINTIWLIMQKMIVVICCFGLLNNCSHWNNEYAIFKPRTSPFEQAAKKYLDLANSAADPLERNKFLLLAAETFLEINYFGQAQKALAQLEIEKLNTDQYVLSRIFYAQISLSQNNPFAAKALIAPVQAYRDLEPSTYKKLYATKINIFNQNGEILEAIQEQIELEKFLLTDQEFLDNRKIIWDKLQQLSPNFLNTANQGHFSYIMHGWLNIAYLTKKYDTDKTELYKALAAWQASFPDHPANTILELQHNLLDQIATSAENFNVLANENLNKIALLLPLSGPYQKNGLAIKNGFLAAAYNKKSQINQGISIPEILILDTYGSSINQAYKQAINSGAELIIGPLIKEDLESLIRSNKLTVPVMALNTVSNLKNPFLFQFGLPPETESYALVDKAQENQHKNALLIIENNNVSQRIAQTLIHNWHLAGKNIIDLIKFDNKTELDQAIKITLGIADSNLRAEHLNNLNIKFKFEPRRRQDLDCIFLITNAPHARQIKPLLNYYYANKIPVYATSSVYSGNPNPNLDRDLDGIQFCDIPWMLDQEIKEYPIYQNIQKLWKENFTHYPRLYALGIDAYKLSDQLSQLGSIPQIGISGMTGILKITKDQVIYRKLIWGTFENGIPIVLHQKN